TRKSGADHPRRAGARNRDWLGNPLCIHQRGESESRGEVAALRSGLERSLPSVSLAVVQISQGKIRKIGGCDGRRRETIEKDRRGPLRKANPQTLESLDALSIVADRRESFTGARESY